MNALIVIDVQNGFINKKTRALPQKIARFIDHNHFDFVLFSQFVNNKNSPFVKQLGWDKAFTSPEIDISPALVKYFPKNRIFRRDVYSAFKSPGLLKFLKTKKITDIYLCGVDLDGCVLASAFEAFDLGFNVKIVKELSVTHSYDHLNRAAHLIIKQNLHQ